MVNRKSSCIMLPRKRIMRNSLLSLLFVLFLAPGYGVLAEEEKMDKTLIVYYSRTGKTRLLCDVLHREIISDILEVKVLDKERYHLGRLGYYTAAFDSVFNRYVPIVPEQPDFSSYSSMIIVSPVWNWKMSAPIRTLIRNNKNKFDAKKIIFITNANEEVTKYEKYGDDAPFLKRYLRDFLRNKCEAMKALVEFSGCSITGYYHLATLEKSDQQIINKMASLIPDIKERLYGTVDLVELD